MTGTIAGVGLHEVVREHAARTPDRIALAYPGGALGYAELVAAAETRAAQLAAAGVRPGHRVPIQLPRGRELVVAVLAVLRLGAAYALLDPLWPTARVRQVIADLDPPLLLAAGTALPAPGAAPDPVPASGDDPACVFFTSGTTGRPKGVLTPHRALLRLFGSDPVAGFGAETVMPQAAPTPWDGYALELWAPLLGGGTSVVVTTEPYLSAQALRDGVARHGVNTAWLTASLFAMLVDEDPGAFAGMRQVLAGGERLSVPHVRRFLAAHPDIALVNGYGPVENTVFATTHRIVAADCDRPHGIPIGRAVPGTGLHVLSGGQSCGTDEPGELHLSGDGLALGYLGDPELTARAFPELPGVGRVYRTGDLVSRDANGLLHYHARADRQVKVRGHRVEPAEVERQVERLLGVPHCVVLARRGPAGAVTGLLAFCTGEVPVDAEARLRAELVGHHVPDRVTAVDVFPLTPNGKLDETALLSTVDERVPAVLPGQDADPLVRRVAAVFAAVLGVPAAPADVPFAALGGTSLDAGRVCARLAADLGRPVPVSRLIAHPTARGLADWLAVGAVGRVATDAPDGDVPLSPMQTTFLTTQLLRPDERAGHCLAAWLVDGPLDPAALERAIAYAHRQHEPLRAAYLAGRAPTARPMDSPPPSPVTLSAGDLDDAVAALRAELSVPLDLTGGQVWRTALVRLRDGRHLFGYVVHHIAFDGWSESVLAADLSAGYRSETGREAPGLARAWIARQNRLAHADLAAQRDHLRTEFTGLPPLRYPGFPDARAGAAPTRHTTAVPAAAVRMLDAVAARAGVTRFTVLFGRYARALAEITGQLDFGIGVPVAQRADPELRNAVGCHVDTVCVRLRGAALTGDPAVLGPLVTAAFAAQDISFGDLVRLVNPPRSTRPALVQNLFALQDNAAPVLDLPGASARFLRQAYLGLPSEMLTEVWPAGSDGGLRVVVHHRPDRVAAETAAALSARFTDLLTAYPEHA
ncbi:AMP-binding protein [Amycolatopsis halotolerans]|uniref:AMP-binding protein n=1 Tax=Amycolatopsis halotolerans TaxID=330083 RepID=A0ABV7QC29_9PSEU